MAIFIRFLMTPDHTTNEALTRINQLASQGQRIQALELAESLLTKNPELTQAWLISAFLYFQTNQVTKATEAIAKARELEPANKQVAFQQVMLLDAINLPQDALATADWLSHNPPADDRMVEQLARFLEINHAFEPAQRLFKQLSKSQPQHSGWKLKLAMIEQNYGRIEQAKELAKEALVINPNNADVLIFLSHLSRQSKNSNHIKQLRALTKDQNLSVSDRAKIYFALAKELEDCQEYQKSFSARKYGADIYRQSYQYDVNSDIGFMQQIERIFNESIVNRQEQIADIEKPIFIVGLPRSGTTLMDRIISSHSDVTAAGELKHFNRCITAALQHQFPGQQMSRHDMVSATAQLDLESLGKRYLANAQTSRGKTPRFTDKFPQNSYYAGLILRALPGAKIIIMQRHPVAVCYSVYKQMFNRDSYPFSYDLEEMADYFIAHDRLLHHWQKIGGDRIKTVYYEDLVADLETQARAVLTFLDLPWQNQCLEFHKNKQAAATASASQVRQKVYTDSVAMWQNYETELQPLISKLKAAGCLDNG